MSKLSLDAGAEWAGDAAKEELAELRLELVRNCSLHGALREAKARLADIAMGADMMLQPACNLKGAMLGYVQEVKRVASTPL